VTRVLVTGGSGFLGRHILPLLVSGGYETHATTRGRRVDVPGVVWHDGDLLDAQVGCAIVASVRPSHLVHLAWEATPGVFWESPDNDRWLESGVALVDAFAAAGGERIVGAGTCAEYEWSDGVCDEASTPLVPATRYGRSKDALRRHVEGLGCSWSWGRVFLVYGPDEHPSRFVPTVVNALLAGRPAEMTSGRQVRDFLDVRDLAAAFTALVESPVEGPVNLGSGEPVTLADVALRIARLVDAPVERVRLGAIGDRPGDPPVLIPRLARLGDEVGWRGGGPLADRLAETVDWWRRHQGDP
jgi:nucleoside-diphosphate-sugar epimerase